MSLNLHPCPAIDVLYWNGYNVYVRCPYCEEIHHHGVRLPGRRQSHCQPGGSYEFVFPIDENSGLVSFEIDKTRALFVKTGVQESDFGDRFRTPGPLPRNPDQPRPNLYNDAKETTDILESDGTVYNQKTTHLAISECVNGNTQPVRLYLESSTERDLFLKGTDKYGNTMLIMAAAEESHDMVSLLLEHGADPNTVNDNRRSPLMEAALWGRITNVKTLLENNASKNLRDVQGLCATDLARSTRRNEKERYQRCEEAAGKQLPERESDRRHIVLILETEETKDFDYTGPLTESERNDYAFTKSLETLTITLHGPVERYQVPRVNKTVAVLHRGRQFTRISATSGWGFGALPLNDKDGPSWTEQVYAIASMIGYNLPDSKYDQGTPGHYFSSHSEKKLIAYFADKHVFTPQDRTYNRGRQEALYEVEELLESSKQTSPAWKKVCELEDHREELDLRLFDEDDMLNPSYDKMRVEQLQQEIRGIDEQLDNLEADVNVLAMRAQQERKGVMLDEQRLEERLMELSQHMPPSSLRRAVILSSNKVCSDCESFTRTVNRCFGLEIELQWCV